jgi:hypothetical protein
MEGPGAAFRLPPGAIPRILARGTRAVTGEAGPRASPPAPYPRFTLPMTWIPMVLAAIAGVAGIRYLIRLRSTHSAEAPPTIDDDAIRRILETGTLSSGPEPLDMEEIDRAEEDFWAESSWDEPEEYPR